MRGVVVFFVVTFGLLFGFAVAQQPDPNALLEAARLNAIAQNQDLKGKIRKETPKRRIQFPIGLFLRGENIQFNYNQPGTGKPQRIHMSHAQGKFGVWEMQPNGQKKAFPSSQLGKAIEDTDLSYEDLAMRFLHWQKAVLKGEEKVGKYSCWLVQADNPGKAGRYHRCKVWIHKDSGALVQVEGFDPNGRALRRFKITDLMTVNGKKTVRRMRVDSLNPASGRSTGVTYLEFDRPKKIVPGKLR